MEPRWSREKAWAWQQARPWLRGCNFMSSDCHNRIDQWQAYGFEERLATADRELAAAQALGFNSVRLILEEPVWELEHDGFMRRLDRYLDTCAAHGVSAMLCFGNDCMRPKELYQPPVMGPQTNDWGYHGGRKLSQHGSFPDAVGYSTIDEPDIAPRWYEMVEEIITAYRNDERVVVWDLYNEPGNSNRTEKCLPHLKRFFEIARRVDPVQPLTTGLWRRIPGPDDCHSEIDTVVLENSDVISYHSYSDYESNVELLEKLRRYGRPLLNTEWLNRMTGNEVFEMFPLFFLENVGCWCWGLVAGLYQTYEPWESLWTRWEKGDRNIDFTRWQHDLLRPSLRPYDPRETELIRRFCDLADSRFAKSHAGR